MIEAVEIHETRITKPVVVKLETPVFTGIWFGIGLMLAPAVLTIIIILIIAVLGLFQIY